MCSYNLYRSSFIPRSFSTCGAARTDEPSTPFTIYLNTNSKEQIYVYDQLFVACRNCNAIIAIFSFLLGHSFILQALDSTSDPIQSFPPWEGAVDLFLVRICSPSPQGTEHIFQFPKLLQTQSTTSTINLEI